MWRHAAAIVVTMAAQPALACGLIFRDDCPENQPKWHWEKPGLTQEQFNRDAYDCMREARDPAWGFGFNPVMRNACIQARGYQPVWDQKKR